MYFKNSNQNFDDENLTNSLKITIISGTIFIGLIIFAIVKN